MPTPEGPANLQIEKLDDKLILVTKLGYRTSVPIVWRYAHSKLYTEVEIPEESCKGTGIALSFYWAEKKLLFLKGSRGCVPFKLTNDYSEMVACRETPLFGGGTREVKQVDAETVVVTEFSATSLKFCFYFVKEDLVPLLFYWLNEVPHFWTVTKDFLFVVTSEGLRVVALASLETLKKIGGKKHGATTHWAGFWSAAFHKNTDDLWLGNKDGRFSVASAMGGHAPMEREMQPTLSIEA